MKACSFGGSGDSLVRQKNAVVLDVARLAGVSAATVSRAISQPSLLKETTLRKVSQAIDKLGYVPHGAARALASSRSLTVGAVIPSLENAIFATTAFALQKVLDDSGYVLVLACNGYDLDAEVRLTRKLIERGVDALVLVGTQHRPEIFTLLSHFKIPYVCTWAFDEEGNLPCVGFDHRKATAKIASHLLSLGHRDFGVISTITRDNDRARGRLAGVLETLERAGVALAPECLIEKPFSFAEGREAFKTMMDQASPKPTAVICLNDVLAIGAIAGARDAGLDVPGDISITGCEDLEVAASVYPGLTTIRYPTFEMGNNAGLYLLACLKGERIEEAQVFPTHLIVRGTTGPPRGLRRSARLGSRGAMRK
jgi:LacI family transcriptional regulator